ncbi:hypothetical protein F4776DRAFT_104715 [Hypoxylon sp. NC0597]|nr:hypothetical protein F4776DRAFT_104715 [Hypoxylon sp. NC0597]
MLTNRRSTLMVPGNVNGKPTLCQPGTRPTLTSQKPESEPHCTAPSLLTSTMPTIPGYSVARVLGAVYGSTTYTLKETKSLLKTLNMGSEVKSLTHITYNARDQAVERMTHDCVSRGANAVVGMTFEEKEILGFVQVSVSGTAVYVEREKVPENPFSPE